MNTLSSYEKKEYVGTLGGSWHERRAVQLERDGQLIGFVNHFEVLTTELGCALLGWPRTPANLKTVERRLRRLATNGRHFHQAEQDGILYSFSLVFSPRKAAERSQLAHRYMEAKRWSCLERATTITEKKTARMFRQEGGAAIIPDGFCKLNDRGYFWEDNTGKDHFNDIVTKSKLYYRDRDYLCRVFDVESFQVVWTEKLRGRVAHIVDSLATIGSGGMFLVGFEDDISIFEPASILAPIWTSPPDRELHTLLEA